MPDRAELPRILKLAKGFAEAQ